MSDIELLQAVLHRACQSHDKELPVKIFDALLRTETMAFLQEVRSVYALYDNVLPTVLSNDNYSSFHVSCEQYSITVTTFYGDMIKAQGRDFLKAALHSDNHGAFASSILNDNDDINNLKYVVELYGQVDQESLNEALGRVNQDSFDLCSRRFQSYISSLFENCGMSLPIQWDSDESDENSEMSSLSGSESAKDSSEDSADHINDVKILNNAPDCVACFEKNVASHAFAPCGHMCLCFKCASAHKFSICPMCRSKGTPFAIRGAELE